MANFYGAMYPQDREVNANGDVLTYSQQGINRLDAFTMAAMQGLCANPFVPYGDVPAKARQLAIDTLVELEKGERR